jgi:hypothetical protein
MKLALSGVAWRKLEIEFLSIVPPGSPEPSKTRENSGSQFE